MTAGETHKLEWEAEGVSLCPDVVGDVGEAVLKSMSEVEIDILNVSQGGRGYTGTV